MAALDRSGRLANAPSPIRAAFDLTGSSPFARLATAHALGLAGDIFLTVALSGSLFFTVSPGSARLKVVWYLLLTMAPFAVVAPVLGPALDRVRGGRRLLSRFRPRTRRRRVVDGPSSAWSVLLYPLAFVVLVLAKTHAVAKAALVPAVVEADGELVKANARLALIGVVVGVVAALPAAAILSCSTRRGFCAWVQSCTSPASSSRCDFQAIPTDPDVAAQAKAEVRAGSVRLASTAMAVLRGGMGYVTFLLAFALKRTGAPALRFGLVLGASAAGDSSATSLRRACDVTCAKT